jgi:hypothetical protein
MNTRIAAKPLDGWLLILGGLCIGLVLWLAPGVSASSRDGESLAKHDFDSLVHAISDRYQMHPKPVPMMWVANVCASRITHGGVRGMRVIEFEDAGRIAKDSAAPAEFGNLIKTQLGEHWSPMVREHDKTGGGSYTYIQNDDDSSYTRLIVVDLDGSELDVVGISLKPDQLAKWMNDHDAAHNKSSPTDN